MRTGFQGARMVWMSSIAMPSLVGLRFHLQPGDEKMVFVFYV